MQAYFADTSRPNAEYKNLLSPKQRLDLLARFENTSAAFCAERGFAADLTAYRAQITETPWSAPDAIPLEHLNAVLDVGAQIAGDTPTAQSKNTPKPSRRTKKRYSVTIRPRPWLVNLIDRVLGKA